MFSIYSWLFFLMTIAFMPFTTAILADFVLDPENRNAAVTTYCIGNMLPIPTLIIAFYYAAHKKRLIDPRLSQKFVNNLYIKLFSGLVVSCISTSLSFSYPIVSIVIILLLFGVYLIPPDSPMYEED